MAGRPYEFPDPNNVTPANPKTVMGSEQILGLYNQTHSNEPVMQKLTDKVKIWIINEAKNQYHWDTAEVVDSYLILGRNDLPIK